MEPLTSRGIEAILWALAIGAGLFAYSIGTLWALEYEIPGTMLFWAWAHLFLAVLFAMAAGGVRDARNRRTEMG